MPTSRCFLALPLPDEARQVLAQLYTSDAGFAWTPPDQLHVTLRFLGELDAGVIEGLREKLRLVRVAPFLLPIEGVGAFPPRGDPQVLWAGVGRAHPLLFQLRQRVDDSLLAVQLAADVRIFQPHVTLARLRPGAAPVAAQHFLKRHREFVGPEFRVTRFGLYTSKLTPAGPVHRLLEEFPLAASGPGPTPSRDHPP